MALTPWCADDATVAVAKRAAVEEEGVVPLASALAPVLVETAATASAPEEINTAKTRNNWSERSELHVARKLGAYADIDIDIDDDVTDLWFLRLAWRTCKPEKNWPCPGWPPEYRICWCAELLQRCRLE